MNKVSDEHESQGVSRRRFTAGLVFLLLSIVLFVPLLWQFLRREYPEEVYVFEGPFDGRLHAAVGEVSKNRFVDIQRLAFEQSTRELSVQLIFVFKGPVDSNSQMEVVIIPLSRSGKSLGREVSICKDQRAHLPPPGMVSGHIVRHLPINSHATLIALPAGENVESVRISFKRI
jgi:hypothetical protein